MSRAPYRVEITSSATLVLTPTTIGLLVTIEEGDPALYRVRPLAGAGEYTVLDDENATLHTTQAGLFHDHCDCAPKGEVAEFDSDRAALIYAQHALTACWPCSAPGA